MYMKTKKINGLEVMLLVLIYALSAVFTFLIIKRSPYMYDRFYFTFPVKAILFLFLGIAGYILAHKYGKMTIHKYGWIIGVLDCFLMICERYFINSSILQNCVLLINPIAIIGTAAFTYSVLNKKSPIKWIATLLPIFMFILNDNVSRVALLAIYILLIMFLIKEKNPNKVILTLYSLLLLFGAFVLINNFIQACSEFGYQVHNKGYMANVIAEGLKTAKSFGTAAVSADGDRQTFILYHIIMNFGYISAAAMVILILIFEIMICIAAHYLENKTHKFIAYSVFLLLLIKTIISIFANSGMVIDGFFTMIPIIPINFFEAISVFTIAGITKTKE